MASQGKDTSIGPTDAVNAAKSAGSEFTEASHLKHQQQQQKRPLNLMQCMDRDGNIDAFRYIEYSKQRRQAFLNRATFICEMKSSLRKERVLSLPGVSMPMDTSVVSVDTTNATGTNSVAFWEKMKDLSRSQNFNIGPSHTPRSSSLPVVSNFIINHTLALVGSNNLSNKDDDRDDDSRATSGLTTSESSVTHDDTITQPATAAKRRKLRHEEFEAAEALLFSMGRAIGASSLSVGGTSIRERTPPPFKSSLNNVQKQDRVKNKGEVLNNNISEKHSIVSTNSNSNSNSNSSIKNKNNNNINKIDDETIASTKKK